MTKQFLHVGCGFRDKTKVKGFKEEGWKEIRFDIDKEAMPDIVGTLTDMSQVPDNSMDALYSSHNIEHLYAHEVPQAIREFKRVLKPEGFAVITCPDLQSVCAEVAKGRLVDALYNSPEGPITPFDMIFGHRKAVATGSPYMAHKSGFTFPVLRNTFLQNGFAHTIGAARPLSWSLWMVAFKTARTEDAMRDVAREFLP